MAISMMVGLISVSTGRLSAPQGSVFSLYCMPGLKCRLINNNSCKADAAMIWCQEAFKQLCRDYDHICFLKWPWGKPVLF